MTIANTLVSTEGGKCRVVGVSGRPPLPPNVLLPLVLLILLHFHFESIVSLSLMTQPTSYKTPLDLCAKEAWPSAPVGDSQVVAGCMPRSGSLFTKRIQHKLWTPKRQRRQKLCFHFGVTDRSVGPQMTSEQTYLGPQ